MSSTPCRRVFLYDSVTSLWPSLCDWYVCHIVTVWDILRFSTTAFLFGFSLCRRPPVVEYKPPDLHSFSHTPYTLYIQHTSSVATTHRLAEPRQLLCPAGFSWCINKAPVVRSYAVCSYLSCLTKQNWCPSHLPLLLHAFSIPPPGSHKDSS